MEWRKWYKGFFILVMTDCMDRYGHFSVGLEIRLAFFWYFRYTH